MTDMIILDSEQGEIIIHGGDTLRPEIIAYAPGPRGIQGIKGDTGDVTPEAQALHDETAEYRDEARTVLGTVVDLHGETTDLRDEVIVLKTDTSTAAANAATSLQGAVDNAALAAASAEESTAARDAARTSETNSKASEVAAKAYEKNAGIANTSAQEAKSAVTILTNVAETARDGANTAFSNTNAARADVFVARDATQTALAETQEIVDGIELVRDETQDLRDAAAASALEAKTYAENAAGSDPANIAYLRRATPPAGTSANNVLTRGVYFFEVAADITNSLSFPVQNRPGRMIVDTSDDGSKVIQHFKEFGNNNEYVRVSQSGGASWASWASNYNTSTLTQVPQAAAEAGTNTGFYVWSPQRVHQAIGAKAADKIHGHEITDVAGLRTALDTMLTDAALVGTPTAPTAAPGSNGQQIANAQFVTEAIQSIVGMAPEDLDTLKEIADRIMAGETEHDALIAQINTKANATHTHLAADITDLPDLLAAKASKVSPAFEGTPTGPNAPAEANDNQLATTKHVKDALAAAGLAGEGHTHDIADIDGLSAALDDKAAFTHTHVAADITDLAGLLNAKAPTANPTFTGDVTIPSPAVGDSSQKAAPTSWVVTALANALSGKANTSHGHAISDITGLETALSGKAAVNHGHTISNIDGLQDAIDAKVASTGGTMTGALVLPASTTTFASLRLPHGGTPTNPVDGDMWTNGSGLFIRIGGSTRSFYHVGNMATMSQAEAEGGVNTSVRAVTAQRIRQAITTAPVGTATQTALDTKFDKAGGAISGSISASGFIEAKDGNFVVDSSANSHLWYRINGMTRAVAYYDGTVAEYWVNLYDAAGAHVRRFGFTQSGTFSVEGDVGVTGKVVANGEIISTATNGLRIVNGDYGAFMRNYNGALYMLVTNSGNQYGSYNALRPLTVTLATGAVAIGHGLSVSGDITASGNITAYSDERLKSDIETITGALDMVDQLRGVRFKMGEKRSLGVIAQEFRKVIPELVVEADNDDKTLSVAYGNTVGVLIEAIKELRAEIRELKEAA